MSQKPLWKQGRQNIGKILTNLVLHAISDPAIHDEWLPLECYVNTRWIVEFAISRQSPTLILPPATASSGFFKTETASPERDDLEGDRRDAKNDGQKSKILEVRPVATQKAYDGYEPEDTTKYDMRSEGSQC